MVESVAVMTGENNNSKMVKVKIRSIRIPELGDKFASNHAQKGTIGMLFSQEDLPYTKDGIVPDVIIDTHCLTGDTLISLCNGCGKDSIKWNQKEEKWC